VRRKKVVWNRDPDTGAVHEAERKLIPRSYVPDVEVSGEVAEKLASHLRPGELWRVAAHCFAAVPEHYGVEAPPHPYGSGNWTGSVIHTKGTVAIYLGTTRVTEDNRGRSISVPRHTFLVEGMVYLVRNLADFEPALDASSRGNRIE